MSFVARLLARTAAATLLVAPVVAVTAGPGQAAACQGTSGVTVVVQHAGAVDVRCAPGDPTSGADALRRAGFTVTTVQGQPFVCRIDGRPSSDPCARVPAADASWSYWSARPGGSWSYSSYGAYAPQSDPAPGSSQGWRFGSGSAPAWAVPAPAPSATPSAPADRPGGGSTGSGGSGATGTGGSTGAGRSSAAQGSDARGSGGAGGGPAATAAPSSPATDGSAGTPQRSTQAPGTAASSGTSGPDGSGTGGSGATAGSARSSSSTAGERTPSRSAASSRSARASAAAPQDVLPTQTPPREQEGPSAAPALAGLGLVALLGAGAVVAARRRRA